MVVQYNICKQKLQEMTFEKQDKKKKKTDGGYTIIKDKIAHILN
jgi:hypothetical protein